MKLKILTVATYPDAGLDMLILSLQRHGYDFEILGMGQTWKGFGTKLIEVRDWCEFHKEEYTHIVFLDAYDTFAMTNGRIFEEAEPFKGVLFNTEKACWPDPEKADQYPENKNPWFAKSPSPYKYLNSGQYLASIPELLNIFNKYPLSYELDDQRYFTDIFLGGRDAVMLDSPCQTFQSIAFFNEKDYKVDNLRLHNLYSDSYPIFIHGNGRTDMSEIYRTFLGYNTLEEVAEDWQDTAESHQKFHDLFSEYLTKFSGMFELRDFVEKKIFGFGERSFYYMWYLIIKAMPDKFSFLEIGVFRGQILALIRMVSKLQKKVADIYGVTPLDSTDGHWESDYAADIDFIHEKFDLHQPKIIKGLSTDKTVIAKAACRSYDIVYIDGGHVYDVVKSDLEVYSTMVKPGGYLVIDDSCNIFNIPNGMFGGIADVSRAVDEFLPPICKHEDFEFLFSIVHNRVYRKRQ